MLSAARRGRTWWLRSTGYRTCAVTRGSVPLCGSVRMRLSPSIVVQDRADAAAPGEQRVAAEPEQVEVERLIGLPLAVTLDFDGDRLRRLAGGEGQRAGLGDVVVVAGLRCAVA